MWSSLCDGLFLGLIGWVFDLSYRGRPMSQQIHNIYHVTNWAPSRFKGLRKAYPVITSGNSVRKRSSGARRGAPTGIVTSRTRYRMQRV